MKSLLFTGSNGFLGKNVIIQLSEMDYDIVTLDRFNACVNCDLSKEIPSMNSAFDIVIHAAGKAHKVPKTNYEKEQFYKVNLQGTKNLCASLAIQEPINKLMDKKCNQKIKRKFSFA